MSDRFLIKDPVHGSIELQGRYLVSIINSKEFQRLRKIKQLGGACYVYPGATHTRFEHSIGVCYIASELIDHLKKKQPNFFIDSSFEKCVKTAALCHDLGHGPFSHLYDIAVKAVEKDHTTDEKNKHLKAHEYRSVKIFESMCEDVKDHFSPNEIKLIGKLITFSEDYKKPEYKSSDPKAVEQTLRKWLKGEGLEKTHYKDKIFLFEIVANGITGVDVDKMDYFLRDGHFTGLTGTFDWRRYIQTLEIKKWGDYYRLCSREKEALEIYQLFHIRNQLFHQAYRHKTTIAVEHMLKQALEAANKNLVIKTVTKSGESDPQPRNCPILKAWDSNMDDFFHLTDSIEDIIMLDLKDVPTDPTELTALPFFLCNGDRTAGIQKARSTITEIRERNFIKFIGEINPGILKLKVTRDMQNSCGDLFTRMFENLKEILHRKLKKVQKGMNEELIAIIEKLKVSDDEDVLDQWHKPQALNGQATIFNTEANDEDYFVDKLRGVLKEVKKEFEQEIKSKLEEDSAEVNNHGVNELVKQIVPEPYELFEAKYLLEYLIQKFKNEKKDRSIVLQEGDFVVEDVVFHYGMKEEDPIKNYLFVGKGDSEPKCLHKDEVSEMLPDKFLERKWMFYVKQDQLDKRDRLRKLLEDLKPGKKSDLH